MEYTDWRHQRKCSDARHACWSWPMYTEPAAVTIPVAGHPVEGLCGARVLARAPQEIGAMMGFPDPGAPCKSWNRSHRTESGHGERRRRDIATYAGTGAKGYAGDGEPAARALLNGSFDVAFDASGNLYFSETFNHCVRRIDAATGFISTVAGRGRLLRRWRQGNRRMPHRRMPQRALRARPRG